jgi:hypothetical protein
MTWVKGPARLQLAALAALLALRRRHLTTSWLLASAVSRQNLHATLRRLARRHWLVGGNPSPPSIRTCELHDQR